MRLIIEYTETDGYTYSHNISKPVIYKSAEDLMVDFENKCKYFCSNSPYKFTIGGATFNAADFFIKGEYIEPTFYTLDEWYEQYIEDEQ